MERRRRVRQKDQTTEYREASVPFDFNSSSHRAASLHTHKHTHVGTCTHKTERGAEVFFSSIFLGDSFYLSGCELHPPQAVGTASLLL